MCVTRRRSCWQLIIWHFGPTFDNFISFIREHYTGKESFPVHRLIFNYRSLSSRVSDDCWVRHDETPGRSPLGPCALLNERKHVQFYYLLIVRRWKHPPVLLVFLSLDVGNEPMCEFAYSQTFPSSPHHHHLAFHTATWEIVNICITKNERKIIIIIIESKLRASKQSKQSWFSSRFSTFLGVDRLCLDWVTLFS